MTVWFTSDLHLGHTRIVELSHRPFKTIQEHDKALASRWAGSVRPDDIVWVLGDISVEGSYKHALGLLKSLPGRKRLITGNHDQAWVGKNDWMRFLPAYQEVFEVVTPWARTKVQGTKVVMSHFPYLGDHTEGSRYDEYRLKLTQDSKPLIHGHVHSQQKLTWTPFGNGYMKPQIHVGVDAWDYRLVSDSEVSELL